MSDFRIGGSNIMWSGADVPREAVFGAAEKHGFGALVPPAPGGKTALRAALLEVYTRQKDAIVRDLKRAGVEGAFTIKDEQPTYTAAGVPDLAYAAELRVSLAPGCTGLGYASDLIFDPPDHPKIPEIQAAYVKECSTLSAGGVGLFLTHVAGALRGLRVRLSGGVWWLPAEKADIFSALGRDLYTATNGTVIVQRQNVVADEDGTAVLVQGVTEEITVAIGKIREEIGATGADALGKRALEHRRDACGALVIRAREFECMLGVALTSLAESAEACEAEAAGAALAAAADDVLVQAA